MNTEHNNLHNGNSGVYYEYRETFYRVTSLGKEVETSRRETSDNCRDLITLALNTSTSFVDGGCLHHWDTASIMVIRFDLNGRKTLFETNLFADDFAK